jgi:hypothetical protein
VYPQVNSPGPLLKSTELAPLAFIQAETTAARRIKG